jgi:hypothetical protein
MLTYFLFEEIQMVLKQILLKVKGTGENKSLLRGM